MAARRLRWEEIKLDDAAYESAGVFDVNNDGILDIVSGGYWYEGPNWTKHKICDVMAADEYFDDFSTIPMDVNGDGYIDFITGGWWGETLCWRENPKGQPVEWTTREIDRCGSIETTRAWDVDGDGELEICPNTPGAPLRFYKLVKRGEKPLFRKILIQREGGSGHGLGFGDITGKGSRCFVVNNGWWEAPANTLDGEWTFHQEFDFGMVSIPIIVADVNGDGVPEIIVGQAHNYGLNYYTQQLNPDGTRTWTKHPIDPWFSQYHDLQWLDIDGDGECELITGCRHRAHCGREPGEDDIVGLYIFKWNGEGFTKQVVDHGKVPGHSGTGIYFSVADLDGNGLLDIVAPGKEGLYVFRNLGFESVGG